MRFFSTGMLLEFYTYIRNYFIVHLYLNCHEHNYLNLLICLHLNHSVWSNTCLTISKI